MPSFMARFFHVSATAVLSVGAHKGPLPSVDSVLTKANSKVVDFAQQAAAMQQKLQAQQEQSRAALRDQKQEYERLLQAQSNLSKAISHENAEIQTGNDKLLTLNTQMAADMRRLSERNGELRNALQDVASKVSAAHQFLADSMKVTDDSNAKELEVLIPSTPKPTLDHFLAITSRDKVSLLAMNTKRNGERPEEMLTILSNSLEELATAEKEGAADLKAHFLESFNQEETRQAELNATRSTLLQARTSLKEQRDKLLEAKAHLEATNKDLHERLRAVRAFASTVDETAVVAMLHPQVSTTDNVTGNVTGNMTSGAAEANATRKHRAAKKTVLASIKKSAAVNASAPAVAINDNAKAMSFKLSEPEETISAKSTNSLRKPAVEADPKKDPLQAMRQWFSNKLR